MGCVLYPPVSLVTPLRRVQRRRPTRTTQQPTPHTPLCISTTRASGWRWPVLTQFSQNETERVNVNTTPTLPTSAFYTFPTEQDPPASRAIATTATTTTTYEKRNHHDKSYYHYRKKNRDGKMEQRVFALPSIALSISVLALGAAIGSGSCMSPPTSGALSAVLGRSFSLGFGLNLSTLAPLLTLAWHAFSLLSCLSTPAAATATTSSRDYYHHYRPLSESSSAANAGDDHRPPSTSTAMRTRTRARIWVPHSLALLWALNTLLVLLVPRWSSAVAFSYAGIAVMSAFEAGALALSGVFARCQIRRELAGETDDNECGWEIDDVADDDGDDDSNNKRKLGEVLAS